MIKGVELTLGDKTMIVPPLSLGAVEIFQERLQKYNGQMDKEGAKLVIDVTLAALKRNYPDMTREQVAELVDLENAAEVMLTVLNASRLSKRANSGNAERLSSGETSTPA